MEWAFKKLARPKGKAQPKKTKPSQGFELQPTWYTSVPLCSKVPGYIEKLEAPGSRIAIIGRGLYTAANEQGYLQSVSWATPGPTLALKQVI